MTTKKKKKKKKINIYFYLDVIIIVLIIILSFLIINKKFLNNNNKNEINNTNNNINNNTNKNEQKDNNDKPLTEQEEKLKYLNNINEKINFFKEDYLDRYVDYKKKHSDLDDETIIVYVNIGLDKEFYTEKKDSPNKYTTTVLANKIYFLGSDYVPKNLKQINSTYSSDKKYLEKDACDAFVSLAIAAKKEGYNIRAVSTYRSYDYQNNLYNNYAKQDGKEKADTYSARPGYSEHQTGLAVDVDNTKVSYTKFGTTKEFNWMKENAYKYGFILRYTKETEFITGYMDEPWHYRYVGLEIAKYIHENPMTYEEYYVRFLDK